MWDHLAADLSTKTATVIMGLLIGATTTWVIARYRLYRQKQNVIRGDARDTVVIHLHVVDRSDSSVPVLRIRSLGQAELARVVPNEHLALELIHRAGTVTSRNTLICMHGAEGSYLLESLMNFVCDRVANAPFDHELYLMAPCCEPAALTYHQPISIVLLPMRDLELFEDWQICQSLKVEHGSDGSRVLTLMDLVTRYRMEQAEIKTKRAAGERTTHLETMYILDLSIDQHVVAVDVKPIPWSRFESVLNDRGLPATKNEEELVQLADASR